MLYMSSSPLAELMHMRKCTSELFRLVLLWKVSQAGLLLVVQPHLVKPHITQVLDRAAWLFMCPPMIFFSLVLSGSPCP